MINRVDSEAAVRSFDREVLQRLPLADAVLSLWAFVMDPTPAVICEKRAAKSELLGSCDAVHATRANGRTL